MGLSRPKDGGRGVILETVTKKECLEASPSPKESVRARMQAVGWGNILPMLRAKT